jgi:hypothetical protein
MTRKSITRKEALMVKMRGPLKILLYTAATSVYIRGHLSE